jgi:FlaA1/EpsC-like NDP-sugar epimerase
VLQAAALAESGQVYVLDKGEPVRHPRMRIAGLQEHASDDGM